MKDVLRAHLVIDGVDKGWGDLSRNSSERVFFTFRCTKRKIPIVIKYADMWEARIDVIHGPRLNHNDAYLRVRVYTKKYLKAITATSVH